MAGIIQAIILDGFHQGHTVNIRYAPTIQLPKPIVIRVDTCCDLSEYPEVAEHIEYKECFRSVDLRMVLYSTTGKSYDIYQTFAGVAYEKHPWTEKTMLYYNMHGNLIKRVEDGKEISSPTK